MSQWILIAALSYYVIGLFVMSAILPLWGPLEKMIAATIWPVMIWVDCREYQKMIQAADRVEQMVELMIIGLAVTMASEAVAAKICEKCGNLGSCTCAVEKNHLKNCRFRKAATLSVELACEHGFQACPKCDPCHCPGVSVPQGLR